MGLSHTVSKINGDFSRNLQIFPPRAFGTPTEGVPLELGTNTKVKTTRMVGLPRKERILIS